GRLNSPKSPASKTESPKTARRKRTQRTQSNGAKWSNAQLTDDEKRAHYVALTRAAKRAPRHSVQRLVPSFHVCHPDAASRIRLHIRICPGKARQTTDGH